MNTRANRFIRILLIILTQLPAVHSVLAQEPDRKDKSEYKSFKSKRQRDIAELLSEASRQVRTEPGSALNKVEEALAMSIARNDAFNEGRCYILLGEINENIEEWGLALDNYTKAKLRFQNTYAKSAEYRRALKGLGEANLNLGHYDEALANYTAAAALSSGAEQQERKLDISEVYYRMTQYTTALEILEERSSFSNNATDPSLTVRIQNQRAKIYARLNNVNKAQNIYQSSQNTARAARPTTAPKGEAASSEAAKEEIASVLHDNKQYDDEIALRNQSIEYNTEQNKLDEVSQEKVALGTTLVAKGETRAAIRSLEEAARLADTTKNPGAQTEAYLALAELYEKNGQQREALSAYHKYSEAAKRNAQRLETRSIERSDLIKKQKDIEELSKRIAIGQREDTIAQGVVTRQRLLIYGLLFIILIVSATTFYTYRSAQARQKANHLLALKSLRSQMNPHFIFNALNSVNHFVAQNDERTANKFLSEFSRLMRLVLENSQEDFIPLYKEEEIIALYLKLEHYRFRDKFSYNFHVDEQINKESFALPPMLIQPYIENAVWHGLRYKESPGTLTVHIGQNDNQQVMVEITDDGIGRKRSAEVKTSQQKKHTSTALKNMEERLGILNRVYNTTYRVDIEDLDKDQQTGTRVRIYLPTTQLNHAAKSSNY